MFWYFFGKIHGLTAHVLKTFLEEEVAAIGLVASGSLDLLCRRIQMAESVRRQERRA